MKFKILGQDLNEMIGSKKDELMIMLLDSTQKLLISIFLIISYLNSVNSHTIYQN